MCYITQQERLVEEVPAWAVTYLEYGDASSLTDEEISMVDEWVESLDAGDSYIIFSWGEEIPFCSRPAFGMATHCIETTILFTNK